LFLSWFYRRHTLPSSPHAAQGFLHQCIADNHG
jgi:hypothetical protein